MLWSPSRFAGLTTLWVSLWPGFFTPVRCICISIGIFTQTRCSAVRMASAWDLSQLPTWQELFRRKLPTINTMHLPSSLLLIVSIVMTICMAHISDILQYKLDGCHIAVNKQQKPCWPFWLQAGSTWPLVYGLTPPDYWELVVGTFYDSKCQKHKTWRWRFFAGSFLPGVSLCGSSFLHDGQWRRAHSRFQRVLRKPNLQVLPLAVAPTHCD